jgi:UDP-N-acetylglucosamine 3-dehydrogenase
MPPVRVAIVGLGAFGQLHAETVANLAETELAGFVDTQPGSHQAIDKRFSNVPYWTQLETAIQECNADAWVIASSTASHAPIARALLAAGKSVLVEKPIAENKADIESLAPLVARDSSNLMAGHIVLFNSEFQQLCREARKRGSIAYIDAVRHRPATTLQRFPNEEPIKLTMIHDLYCVLVLMNREEPRHFSAQLHHTQDGRCDLALAQIEWDSGVVASLTASFLTPPGIAADGFDRLEVFGQGWAARIQPNPRPIELWDDRARWPMGLEMQANATSTSGMLAEELRCFSRVVRGEQVVPVGATYADALQIHHWIEQLESIAQLHSSTR